MADSSKVRPSTKSAVASAEVHRDLQSAQAGGSGTTRTFRSSAVDQDGKQDQEYEAFFKGKEVPSRVADVGEPLAVKIFASSWRDEDLQPLPSDGANVLQMLASQDDSQSELAEELSELSTRRAQPWQMDADTSIPRDPESTTSTFPYLSSLLSLPEDQSISSYLANSSYSDDVWGLPMTLKRDLDTVRSKKTGGRCTGTSSEETYNAQGASDRWQGRKQ